MAGPKCQFRKGQFDRMLEDFGLGGRFVTKDMSLYPKLEVSPLPFPTNEDYEVIRERQIADISSNFNTKFRESANYNKRNLLETPDVERYNGEITLEPMFEIDFDRLPLELHPNYRKMKAERRKRKSMIERSNLEKIKKFELEGDPGAMTEKEKNELLGIDINDGEGGIEAQEEDEEGHMSDDNIDDTGDYGDTHFENGEEDADI